jgi:hypothetical protein
MLLAVIMVSLAQRILSEFIPLVMTGGAPHISVEVEGATNNPQKLLFDTGSPHTYILNHRMLRNLPRARINRHNLVRGIRGSVINTSSLSVAEASHVDFVQFKGLKLLMWTRRKFKASSMEWNQKFAVARLPPSELDKADPEDNGLIGATPLSHFTTSNPQYGFFPNPDDWPSMNMFVTPIDSQWCRDTRIEYVGISHANDWTIPGRLTVGSNFVLADSIEFLIDSGTGLINLPEKFYYMYMHHLYNLRIQSLDWTRSEYPTVSPERIREVPPFVLSFSAGFSLTIPSENFIDCKQRSYCLIRVGRKKVNSHWITFGEPLFRTFITQFDSEKKRIHFCEPNSTKQHSPLISTLLAEDRPKPWDPRRAKMWGEEEDDPDHHHYRLPGNLVEDNDKDSNSAENTSHVYFLIILIAIIIN